MLRLTLDEGDTVDVVRKVGEDHSLFVVVFTEDLVFVEVEPITDAEPEMVKKSFSEWYIANVNISTAFPTSCHTKRHCCHQPRIEQCPQHNLPI